MAMPRELHEKLANLIEQADQLEADESDPEHVGRYRSLILRTERFLNALGYPHWREDASRIASFDHTSIDEDDSNDLRSILTSVADFFVHEDYDPKFISRPPRVPSKVSTSKIFVVHGHDSELTNAVARFLEKVQLEPIILHEQPNQGYTIIEKFEAYADVGFAVVLLTPDDIGGASRDQDSLRPRARQNVILELGYFLGKLGRESVACIYKQDVEIPSDYQGVLFIPYDANGMWRLGLTRELKSAGMAIDMNNVV